MAALDWFAAEVAARRPSRRPRPARSRRVRARAARRAGGSAAASSGSRRSRVAARRRRRAQRRGAAREHERRATSNKQQLELQAQNATLASQVSSAGSSLRIEQAARRLGLVPAPAADTSYLDLARK